MRWTTTGTLIGAAFLVQAFITPRVGQAADDKEKRSVTPKSLERFYPPLDKHRTYTLEMLELGRLLGSVNMDLRTQDKAKLVDGIGRFITQYEKVMAMVPEWKPYFPASALAELKKSISDGGDIKAAEAPFRQIDESCTHCHQREMFRVQATYDWPRFTRIKARNSKDDEVPFHTTMVELSNRMGALPTAVARGNFEEAMVYQKDMATQFGLLESSCENCHTESRAYFVDRTVKGEILKMGGMIKRKSTDQADYKRAIDTITEKSCIPCHQVHMPAAYMQMQMESGR